MRRVMIDGLSDGSHIVTDPDAHQRTIDIPVATDGNVGKTGLIGVGDIIFSRQNTTIEIEKTGIYDANRYNYGSRFKVLLDYLRNESDVDLYDSIYCSLGADPPISPHFIQMVENYNATELIGPPKMIELTKWKNANTNYGYSAIMCYNKQDLGTNIYYTQIKRMKIATPNSATNQNFQWENVTHNLPLYSPAATVYAFPCDIVEMEDGSLILAISRCDAATWGFVDIYQSADCGTTWALINTLDVSAEATSWTVIDIERFGERLVLVYQFWNGAASAHVRSRYSDDRGYTWSSYTTVWEDLANAIANPSIDLFRGSDSSIYVAFSGLSGGFYNISMKKTLNGANWIGTPKIAVSSSNVFPFSVFQRHYGDWGAYYTNGGAGPNNVYHRHCGSTDPVSGSTAWSGAVGIYEMLSEATDPAGAMSINWVHSRPINSDGFLEFAVVYCDTAGGTTHYSLAIYRCAMWTAIQMPIIPSSSPGNCFTSVWDAHTYPATADPHPNLNAWQQTLVGAGSTTVMSTTGGGHLRVGTGAGAGCQAYYYKNTTAEGWVNGMSARFVMKLNSADSSFVGIRLCSNGNNTDVRFYIFFTPTQVILYDVHAAAIVSTITPTKWNPADWQEYVVIAKENDVSLYRSFWHRYRYMEIRQYEEVFYETGLQENAYAADNDTIMWGSIDHAVAPSTSSDSQWKSFMFADASLASYSTTDFYSTGYSSFRWGESYITGKKCSPFPCGIFQGIGCKWSGNQAFDGDTWEFKTSAQYAAKNLFVASPRIKYMEPDPGGVASVDRIVDWRHADSLGSTMPYYWDSLAVIGTNCPYFQLGSVTWDGVTYSARFSNEPGAFPAQGNILYRGLVVNAATAVYRNRIRVGAGTSGKTITFFNHQFASNDCRKYYIVFTSGTLAGYCFKILDNYITAGTQEYLLLDVNVEGVWGALPNDTFDIYTDRFYHPFVSAVGAPSVLGSSRLRFTMAANGLYPPFSEGKFFVGSLLVGMSMKLDDAWESTIQTVPNLNTVVGRSKQEHIKELSAEQRIIDLAYTGQTDYGMGIQEVEKFYKYARWGVYPLVWIDDDSGIGITNQPSHVDPILARVKGPITQRRVAYNYLTQDGSNWKRNILDVDGIQLEEVL